MQARAPPGVEEEDVGGDLQVEAFAASAQRQQDHVHRGVGLQRERERERERSDSVRRARCQTAETRAARHSTIIAAPAGKLSGKKGRGVPVSRCSVLSAAHVYGCGGR
jgi:hypothetical protein